MHTELTSLPALTRFVRSPRFRLPAAQSPRERAQASLLGIFRGEQTFAPQVLYAFGRSLVSLYAGLMLDRDVVYRAPLPEGPRIYVPNHPTTTDPLYLATILREQVSCVITPELFRAPAVGRYLRVIGQLPATRNSGGATVEAMVRELHAGRSVAILPEGALSPLAGGLCRAHSGAARAALRTGFPVVPIGIGVERDRISVARVNVGGEEEIGHFYTGGAYAVTVGRSLTFSGDAEDRTSVNAATEMIMQQIGNLARQSESRILARRPSQPSAASASEWLRRSGEQATGRNAS